MEDILLSLSNAEFREIVALVYARFGIHLSEQKRTLVQGRLSKRVRHLGLSSFASYLEYMRNDRSGQEAVEFINRITTNHSYFYREKSHFDYLSQTVLPDIKRKLEQNRSYPLRIWSAGCATGEEPYTLAMAIHEGLGPLAASIDWGILATDVSRAALEEAIHGEYAGGRIKELPAPWRSAYMDKTGEDLWTVKPQIRSHIMYKRLNLMEDNYPLKGLFDVILCRNVMIYFDIPVRKALVDRLHRYVKPGGYFFVGHSESLPRETCPFDYVCPAVYRKAGRA